MAPVIGEEEGGEDDFGVGDVRGSRVTADRALDGEKNNKSEIGREGNEECYEGWNMKDEGKEKTKNLK